MSTKNLSRPIQIFLFYFIFQLQLYTAIESVVYSFIIIIIIQNNRRRFAFPGPRAHDA